MRILKSVLFILVLPSLVLSQTAHTSRLTGTVYDASGAVIVGAKITATGVNGKKFHAVSNEEGVYTLTLPYDAYPPQLAAKYDVLVEGTGGFQPSEIKGYVFIPSQFKKMFLDIALVGVCNDCHQIQVTSEKP